MPDPGDSTGYRAHTQSWVMRDLQEAIDNLEAVSGGSGVSSLRALTAATITRPANTTPYAAGDAVGVTAGTVLTFADAASASGGPCTISKLKVTTNNRLELARYALYVFNASPTLVADNATLKLLTGEMASFQGVIQTEPSSGGTDATGTASFAVSRGEELLCVAASGDANLYGILVILDAQTPISAETYAVEILVQ
jgi:hypothetical protein